MVYPDIIVVISFEHVALMCYRMGDFQEAYTYASKALKLYPNHLDSKELINMLQKTFLNN